MSSLIKQHRGRVAEFPGNSLLAAFGSVADAVQCSVPMQNIEMAFFKVNFNKTQGGAKWLTIIYPINIEPMGFS